MSQPINTIGIDLAKNTFQVCAADSKGNSLFNKAIKRQQMNELISNTPPCTIVLEACATAHHWARVFANQGHIVKLIHPAYVRPFVKSNKNDSADAGLFNLKQWNSKTFCCYIGSANVWYANEQHWAIRPGVC